MVPSSLCCASATERVVEIYPRLEGDHFLSLPVDEPAIDPLELRRAAPEVTCFGAAGALTFYCDFYAPQDYQSHLSAKVITDCDGLLLYMSRAVIPSARTASSTAPR